MVSIPCYRFNWNGNWDLALECLLIEVMAILLQILFSSNEFISNLQWWCNASWAFLFVQCLIGNLQLVHFVLFLISLMVVFLLKKYNVNWQYLVNVVNVDAAVKFDMTNWSKTDFFYKLLKFIILCIMYKNAFYQIWSFYCHKNITISLVLDLWMSLRSLNEYLLKWPV